MPSFLLAVPELPQLAYYKILLVLVMFILTKNEMLFSYDPDFICNSSDESGRYSYRKQPEICHWNLKKFAEAIQVRNT